MESDSVRVRESADASALGLTGKVGRVLGESIPSLSGVPVTGPCPDDFALYVDFESGEGAWLAPELLELDPAHYTAEDLQARADSAVRARSRTEAAVEQQRSLDRPAARAQADFLGRLLDRIWPA